MALYFGDTVPRHKLIKACKHWKVDTYVFSGFKSFIYRRDHYTENKSYIELLYRLSTNKTFKHVKHCLRLCQIYLNTFPVSIVLMPIMVMMVIWTAAMNFQGGWVFGLTNFNSHNSTSTLTVLIWFQEKGGVSFTMLICFTPVS